MINKKKAKRHFYHKHYNRRKKMFKIKNIALRLMDNDMIEIMSKKMIDNAINRFISILSDVDNKGNGGIVPKGMYNREELTNDK